MQKRKISQKLDNHLVEISYILPTVYNKIYEIFLIININRSQENYYTLYYIESPEKTEIIDADDTTSPKPDIFVTKQIRSISTCERQMLTRPSQNYNCESLKRKIIKEGGVITNNFTFFNEPINIKVINCEVDNIVKQLHIKSAVVINTQKCQFNKDGTTRLAIHKANWTYLNETINDNDNLQQVKMKNKNEINKLEEHLFDEIKDVEAHEIKSTPYIIATTSLHRHSNDNDNHNHMQSAHQKKTT
ncbi:CLUMA_CG004763, isoform A [Clunio marinus]|uniref:CLUMA_CG004763, isoform A n=1 Tax=Clunio marinus TaxID=568069 RepID=A0A1J1HSV4_9DIPT|nr:CLUMA_CG004763, isoform A [Clunio marinus]